MHIIYNIYSSGMYLLGKYIYNMHKYRLLVIVLSQAGRMHTVPKFITDMHTGTGGAAGRAPGDTHAGYLIATMAIPSR